MQFELKEVVAQAALKWRNNLSVLTVAELAKNLSPLAATIADFDNLLVPTEDGHVTISPNGMIRCTGRSVDSVTDAILTTSDRIQSIFVMFDSLNVQADLPFAISKVNVLQVRGTLLSPTRLQPLNVFNKRKQKKDESLRVFRHQDGTVSVTFNLDAELEMEVHATGTVVVNVGPKYLSHADLWNSARKPVRDAVADLT